MSPVISVTSPTMSTGITIPTGPTIPTDPAMPAGITTPSASTLYYARITPENLHLAVQIQSTIWPHNSVDRDYLMKADETNDPTNVSWLVYHRDTLLSQQTDPRISAGQQTPGTLIGLTGVYTYDPDETGYDGGESIWMDWFGVLRPYRGQGFGEKILRDTIRYARQLAQFRYFRLDTSDFAGRVSTKLYDKVMQLREDYTAETYPSGCRGLIYSYSLGSTPPQPWGNRLLDLKLYDSLEQNVL